MSGNQLRRRPLNEAVKGEAPHGDNRAQSFATFFPKTSDGRDTIKAEVAPGSNR